MWMSKQSICKFNVTVAHRYSPSRTGCTMVRTLYATLYATAKCRSWCAVLNCMQHYQFAKILIVWTGGSGILFQIAALRVDQRKLKAS
jgi:hypothetical protein